MARFFQGRMLYPRGHRRQGRPHPFLYAGARNRRTRAHAYYGTQPTGYGLRGGDPRFSGVSGAAGRAYQHMLGGAMQRQVPNWVRTRRVTPWGRQARRDMADQRREYQSQLRADRRSLREINKKRRQLNAWGGGLVGLAGKLGWEQPGNALAELNAKRQALLSEMRNRRTSYQKGRRRTATRRPMHATVTRHPWYGYGGWRPTSRRTWGNYSGINWGQRRQRA